MGLLFRCFLFSEGKSSTLAYPDILNNAKFPKFSEEFGERPFFIFQHDCAPVHKARSIKT